MKTMDGRKSRGQTAVETIILLAFLLTIFFLIAEFARAWYLKNSLNNAVRVGVRIAAVTPGLTDDSGTCPTGSTVLGSVCDSPGVPDGTEVVLTVIDEDLSGGTINPGDTVIMNARAPFTALVPLVEDLLPESAFSEAVMRHE